jgi:hypothetical protein
VKSVLRSPSDLDTFRRDVLFERALLAAVDPGGERDAVAPVSPVRARQILLDLAPRGAVRPPRRPPSPFAATGGRLDPDELVRRLGGDPSRRSGRVPCPAHGGRDRNLAWRMDRDRVLLTCWSHGCSFEDILEAVQ